MSATVRRGFLYFGILVLVVAFGCIGPAFFWLPQMRIGVPLPVITLPGEVLAGNILGIKGADLTNTFTSMILVDILLLLIGVFVWRATNGVAPDKFVPRGFTNFIELITEFLYNQAKTLLGPHTSKAFPLAMTVFMLLLVANWIKLIPGVESVGVIACAEEKQPGYGIWGQDDSTPGIFLNVNSLDLGGRAGTKATLEDLHACEAAHPEFTPPLVLAKRERGEEPAVEHETAPAEGEHQDATPESGGTPEATESSAIMPTTFVDSTTSAKAAEGGNPDLFVVIPYFRALATDLNFPLALAIVVVLMVQVWGVQSLGPAYFFKFINIPALGNMAKKPLGLIDFIVGLVEIISEISRIVSLSFRLFGNIFAGGVLLIVMTFLVAGFLPSVFYFLEIFVGAIQAYVFATLTIIYASQAVVGHHSDDDEHDEHGDHH